MPELTSPTQTDLQNAIWSLKPGETLILKGSMPACRVSKRVWPARVTIDMTGATVDGPWSFQTLDGVTFKGGLVKGGIRLDNSLNISFEGVRFERSGVFLNAGSGFVVSQCQFAGSVGTAVSATKAAGLIVRECLFSDINGDAMQVPGCRDVQIVGNIFTRANPSADVHPDFAQTWDVAGFPMSNFLIADNYVRAKTQGIFLAGKIQGLRIERNLLDVGFSHAVSVSGSDDVTLTDNIVRTLEGSPNQALIRLAGSTNVKIVGRNTFGAHVTPTGTRAGGELAVTP